MATGVLTITDRADGTGADGTVSGFGPAESVKLQYAAVNGEIGGLSWQSVPSHIGNGSISANIATGYYLWVAVGGLGTVSNPVYQNVTDGLAAVHDRILDAVVARIAALNLDGIKEVKRHKITDPARFTCPACIVTSADKNEQMLGGLMGHDDIGYPAYVQFISTTPANFADEGRVMLWRQQVSRSLRYQRLPGVPEPFYCTVEPDPVFQVVGGGDKYQLSAMLFRYTAREVRGFGA